jgi:hypothetical protein
MVGVVGDGDRDKPTGPRYAMPCRPGSHVAYARGKDLVVEWYDFGPDAPYESANLLIFAKPAQEQLAVLIGLELPVKPKLLARQVADRFGSYFEVQDFARENKIEFLKRVNFWP